MAVHSVSYDLRQPGRNYEPLYALLKSTGVWCRVTESHWLLNSSDTAVSLRDKIEKIVDSNDAVAVVTITTPTGWATHGLSSEKNDWLRSQLG